MPEQRGRLTMAGPAQYRVRLQGVIERNWVDQLARMRVSYRNVGRANARTILTGEVLDQAELMGLLNRLYGLGLPLVSVQWLERLEEAQRSTAASSNSPDNGVNKVTKLKKRA
jgi:hypothetical protein